MSGRIAARVAMAAVGLLLAACDSTTDDASAVTTTATPAAVASTAGSTAPVPDAPTTGAPPAPDESTDATVSSTSPDTETTGAEATTDDTVESGASGGNSATNDEQGNIDVESDGTRLVVGDIPPELADDAPLPPDATIELVTATDQTTTFVATSALSIDSATDFYRSIVADFGAEATVTPITDDVARIVGLAPHGEMTVVLSGGPDGGLSITVEIVR